MEEVEEWREPTWYEDKKQVKSGNPSNSGSVLGGGCNIGNRKFEAVISEVQMFQVMMNSSWDHEESKQREEEVKPTGDEKVKTYRR